MRAGALRVGALRVESGHYDSGRCESGHSDMGQSALGRTESGRSELGRTNVGWIDEGRTDSGHALLPAHPCTPGHLSTEVSVICVGNIDSGCNCWGRGCMDLGRISPHHSLLHLNRPASSTRGLMIRGAIDSQRNASGRALFSPSPKSGICFICRVDLLILWQRYLPRHLRTTKNHPSPSIHATHFFLAF